VRLARSAPSWPPGAGRTRFLCEEASGRRQWEWHSEALLRYVRMTKQVEAVIAGACRSGTQHAPGSACTRRAVQGGGRQGCRQPNLAEGADGLGGVGPLAG
jgi:hypothetical protein